MARLRDPEGGCPWDLEQTFASLVPHTLEEAYEVAEAAESGDPLALCDELGDLLFQVVFYARIAEEQGQFDLDAVTNAICNKLIRRHPHVFADASVADVAEQSREWERHKAAERSAQAAHGALAGALAGISTALPAVTRTAKLTRRAARVGFDPADAQQLLDQIDRHSKLLRQALANQHDVEATEAELGQLMFSCVNLARTLELDPESALRAANRRFESRFGRVEDALSERGEQLSATTPDALRRLWQLAE